MGWPPSRVRGQTRRQSVSNDVFKRSRSLRSRIFLPGIYVSSRKEKFYLSFIPRYSYDRSFFLFSFLETIIHKSVLLVLFQEEQFDVGEIPSANLEDRTVSGEVEVRGPIVARDRDEAYSSRR